MALGTFTLSTAQDEADPARVIQLALPGIGRGMDAVTPVVDSSVRRGFSDDQALPPPQTGNISPAAPAE